MGFLASKLPQPKEIFNLSVTDPKAWNSSLWRLFGSQSQSGEYVDEYTALTYSAVWCAVNLISGAIASLPLHLIQRKGKTKVHAKNHPLYRLMYAKPNPYMEAKVLREVMIAHMLTWGNAYAEIVRDKAGRVVELWPISPNRVTPEWKDGELVYRINVENKQVYLGRDKILHIHGLGFDGLTGYSAVSMGRKSFGLGMAMETFGALYFGNGTHPSAVVTHPNKLKDDNLRAALSEVYGGLGNSHSLMLLEDGMKIDKVGIPPEDSQFLESRQFQIPEIARWFNLPPHKLKDLTRSSFSNIESEQISYMTDSLLPWIMTLEGAYNTQLLTESEFFVQDLYFKHNVDGILRADAAARGSYYREMWNIGTMSQNEIRDKEDMDPDPNPLADERFIPAHMIPMSMVKEYLQKNDPANAPKSIPNQPQKAKAWR
jgi:HK97 family phage portal protein